jgi:hypothetical protein
MKELLTYDDVKFLKDISDGVIKLSWGSPEAKKFNRISALLPTSEEDRETMLKEIDQDIENIASRLETELGLLQGVKQYLTALTLS